MELPRERSASPIAAALTKKAASREPEINSYRMAAEGGEAAEDLIEILEASSTPIDLARYVNHVRDPAAGAIATFEGTTRDTFEGKRVLELRYEAYVPMALRRLRAICSAARAAWSLRRLALAHRLGTVSVGEASVFVAASAVHRADALEACRFLIDEVKASVPIWKKEVYANGEVWKENREFLQRRNALASSSFCCATKVRMDDDDDDDAARAADDDGSRADEEKVPAV